MVRPPLEPEAYEAAPPTLKGCVLGIICLEDVLEAILHVNIQDETDAATTSGVFPEGFEQELEKRPSKKSFALRRNESERKMADYAKLASGVANRITGQTTGSLANRRRMKKAVNAMTAIRTSSTATEGALPHVAGPSIRSQGLQDTSRESHDDLGTIGLVPS